MVVNVLSGSSGNAKFVILSTDVILDWDFKRKLDGTLTKF